ncbi:uncharacterized protein BDV14DRAFT_30428 [Aspergillus stella-maris]|uniref:uncharacterized protein n=1 Tax=Aspergillus stella-maris TaxID=1810926 RepID=UPI003CCD57D0
MRFPSCFPHLRKRLTVRCFVLRFSRIGTRGLAFYICFYIGLPGRRFLSTSTRFLFSLIPFLDTYGVRVSQNRTVAVSVVGLARSLCMRDRGSTIAQDS